MDRAQDLLDDLGARLAGVGIDTTLGIALLVIGVFVALKAAKLVVKLAMIPVVLAGVYLWLAV